MNQTDHADDEGPVISIRVHSNNFRSKNEAQLKSGHQHDPLFVVHSMDTFHGHIQSTHSIREATQRSMTAIKIQEGV